MQVNKIEFGKSYAIRASNDDGFESFRVAKIISEKTDGNTVNYVSGNFETGRRKGEAVKLEVSKLEGPVEEYAALMAEKKRIADENKRKDEEQAAMAAEAGKLLGKKLGVEFGTEYRLPIRISRADITVNSSAIPALVAFLKG